MAADRPHVDGGTQCASPGSPPTCCRPTGRRSTSSGSSRRVQEQRARPGRDRRRDHRPRRGHHRLLRARGRAGDGRLLHPPPHRQGPAPDRLRSGTGCTSRSKWWGRSGAAVSVISGHRHRAVGHQGQGDGRAGPHAARRADARADARLRVDRRHPGRPRQGRSPRSGAGSTRGIGPSSSASSTTSAVRLRRRRGRVHPSPGDRGLRERTRRTGSSRCARRSAPRSTSSSTTTWARQAWPLPMNLNEAARVLQALEPVGCCSRRSRCRTRTSTATPQLRQRTTTPIAGGEMLAGLHEFRAFIEAGRARHRPAGRLVLRRHHDDLGGDAARVRDLHAHGAPHGRLVRAGVRGRAAPLVRPQGRDHPGDPARRAADDPRGAGQFPLELVDGTFAPPPSDVPGLGVEIDRGAPAHGTRSCPGRGSGDSGSAIPVVVDVHGHTLDLAFHVGAAWLTEPLGRDDGRAADARRWRDGAAQCVLDAVGGAVGAAFTLGRGCAGALPRCSTTSTPSWRAGRPTCWSRARPTTCGALPRPGASP